MPLIFNFLGILLRNNIICSSMCGCAPACSVRNTLSVFHRKLQRERLNRFSYCFRLTRSTEVRSITQTTITTPQNILRVSVLFILRVSPKAGASAIKSLHSLLSLNTEYGGQGRIVQAIIPVHQATPPCLRSLFPPCFAEGQKAAAFKYTYPCKQNYPCIFVHICVRAEGQSGSDKSVYVIHKQVCACVIRYSQILWMALTQVLALELVEEVEQANLLRAAARLGFALGKDLGL